ncbi:MAG TPA: AraC family transcriptional regulator [Burkholderiales bacterium]|nr:AraC family transcriptional regulator [Burkholderiales bacterium]
MDALSDLLHAVRLKGALFLEARFTAPWCVETHPSYGAAEMLRPLNPVVFFHLVAQGRCKVRLAPHGEPIDLASGDLVLMPQGDTNLLGSDLQLAPVDADTLLRPVQAGGLATIDYGGGGDEARILCGFLSCDKALCRLLLDALPRLLRVPLGDGPGAAWLMSLARRGAQENTAPGPGSGTLLAKLAELLFVEAMRRYIESLPEQETGWLAGLRDRYVGRALSLMHEQPARDWTGDELAERVGLSRSALAQRFADLLGQPPMQYLTRWRLTLAAAALGSSDRAIAQVAEEFGYESESAFNRAFKREFEMPPAAWRRQRNGNPGGTGSLAA